MKLTTTKKLLRSYKACENGYAKLRAALGPDWPDTKPIPLWIILKSNGLDDALWSLRAVPEEQRAERDKVARLYACWCARKVWHLLTDERSRNAVRVAERFARGRATVAELVAALAAAGSAAWAAARAAERAASWAAARDAALDAARAAKSARLMLVLGGRVEVGG